MVSIPSWELFEKQDLKYKESVFPQDVPVLSIEALSTFGWSRYAHASIGMTTFGASAPANVEINLTVKHIDFFLIATFR